VIEIDRFSATLADGRAGGGSAWRTQPRQMADPHCSEPAKRSNEANRRQVIAIIEEFALRERHWG